MNYIIGKILLKSMEDFNKHTEFFIKGHFLDVMYSKCKLKMINDCHYEIKSNDASCFININNKNYNDFSFKEYYGNIEILIDELTQETDALSWEILIASSIEAPNYIWLTSNRLEITKYSSCEKRTLFNGIEGYLLSGEDFNHLIGK